MTEPLQRPLEGFDGMYETLFLPGKILEKDTKKGWVLKRTPLSQKNRGDYFAKLVTALSSESFEGIPNPEGLIQRVNICIQKPPIPKALPDGIVFKSSCPTFAFLSNFFPSLIIDKKKLFRSSEQLYQWRILVALDPEGDTTHYEQLHALSPLQTRKYSHRIQASLEEKITDDVKLEIMEEVVSLKFRQNPPLREALHATFPRPLIENTESPLWGGDANHMGRILQVFREQLLHTKQ